MAKAQEIVLVGGVINALTEANSCCGETHIQKCSYIAKSVEKVPFDSHFILYKHGPYSFDLNSILNNMRSQNIVDVSRVGLGSTYKLSSGIWSAMEKASEGFFDAYRAKVDSVCQYLALKTDSELERITTAIFVRLNFGGLDEEERIAKLIEIKPHITSNQAAGAFAESLNLLQA